MLARLRRAAHPGDRDARRLQHDLAGRALPPAAGSSRSKPTASTPSSRERTSRRAGLGGVVDISVGPALETLPEDRAPSRAAPFDLIFIDADKTNTPEYFDWALKLSAPAS